MRSRATRSWATPTGKAGTTTAAARRPTAGWVWRAWSATSPTCQPKTFGDKFGRRLQFADDIRYTLTEPEFEVKNYLRYQADSFVRRFDANTYLYTSRALTYFNLARQYRQRVASRALRHVTRTNAADHVSSDWLYPPAGS